MMERLIYISLIEDIISTYLWVWCLAVYATGYFCVLRGKEEVHGMA